MKVIYAIGYILIIAFCYSSKRKISILNNGNISGMSGLLFGFMLYYGVVPLIVVINLDSMKDIYIFKKYYSHYIDRSVSDFFYGLLMSAIALFVLVNEYKRSYQKETRRQRKFQSVSYDSVYRILKMVGLLCLIVGGGSFIILAISLGGIKSTLAAGEQIRQHYTSLSSMTSLYLLYIPAKILEITPFIFYILEWKRKKNIVWLIISLLLVSLYYLFNSSRSQILIFLICFIYLVYMRHIKEKKLFWPAFIVAAVIALPLLDLLDDLFLFFQNGSWNVKSINYLRYIVDFSAPHILNINLHTIVEEYGYRYFFTFFEDILSLLPGVDFDPTYVNTSLFISGPYWVNTGGIPNDLITFGYIQFGPIGVIVICYFVAKLISTLDCTVNGLDNKSLKLFFGIMLATRLWDLIASADFRTIIQGRYVLLLTIITLLYIRKHGLKKRNEYNNKTIKIGEQIK